MMPLLRAAPRANATASTSSMTFASTYNDRSFFSARVKPRSLKYHYVYSGWSIPALALK